MDGIKKIKVDLPPGYVPDMSIIQVVGRRENGWTAQGSGKQLYDGLMEYLKQYPLGTLTEFCRLAREGLDGALLDGSKEDLR